MSQCLCGELESLNLFQNNSPRDEGVDKSRPLADRMRPRTLDEFVGQEHILGLGKSLRVQIERDDTVAFGTAANDLSHSAGEVEAR